MYSTASWIDRRLEVRPSAIACLGLVAGTAIPTGAAVVVWGGQEVEVWRRGCVAVAEDRYLAGSDASDFLNHSCDSNLWMQDAVTLVVRRAVAAGEEATVDYALFEADERWRASWRCRCGSAHCRGVVSGEDWRAPQLQARYGGHLSPFLENRIRRQRGVRADGH